MITFGRAYVTSDGTAYPTLEKAMVAELAIILSTEPGSIPNPNVVAQAIMEKRKGILDTLSMNGNSRPGARKPRKKAVSPAPAVAA